MVVFRLLLLLLLLLLHGGVVSRLERRIPIGDPAAWKPDDNAERLLYCDIVIVITTALPLVPVTVGQ